MHVRTLVLGTFAAALLAACATQEPAEPAPQPAPAPAPTPAPQPAPQPVEAPKPVAKPEAPKPEAPKPKPPSVVNLSATQLFAYDSATLSDAAKKALDEQVVAKLKDLAIRYININGHTDRIGSPQYNQQLSEKRAEAVRDYLASRGVDASKMETFGFGKTLPVQHCSGRMPRDVLIACLQPNRRVVVEIQGTPR